MEQEPKTGHADHGSLESGKQTKSMGTVLSITPTETNTKASGSTIKQMETASTRTRTEQGTTASGLKMSIVESAQKPGLTVLRSKASTTPARRMEKAN